MEDLESLKKQMKKLQDIADREYLPLYAQGKLDAYKELLPLVEKLIHTQSVTKRFVLLKGKGGHVFWTTNIGDIDNDFNKILFESDSQDEIIEQWEKHNPNVW